MSKSITSARSFPRERPSKRPFGFEERPLVSFPIQRVEIDWDRLIAKRPMLLESLDVMPKYLLKPEVLDLLECESHQTTHHTAHNVYYVKYNNNP